MADRCGPYELLERLSAGGMAELFRARGPGRPHDVVIKRLLPALAADPDANAMFVDEARVTARLSHPNIVAVYELGKHEQSLYIAMELVDGVDLLDLIKALVHAGRAFPPGAAVWIACEVLDALVYAHDQTSSDGTPLEIVHRDISPANILLRRDGRVKLADFGVARARELDHASRPGEVRGKYGYMSPEQVSSEPVDGRSDLFSVGIVLAEMLIGQPLFWAERQIDRLKMIRDVRLDRLDEAGAHLDPDLRSCLLGALCRRPADRFASAREMSSVLAAWLRRHDDGVRGAAAVRALVAEHEAWIRSYRAACERAETYDDSLEVEMEVDIEVTRPGGFESRPPGLRAPDEDAEIIAGEASHDGAGGSLRFAADELAEVWSERATAAPAVAPAAMVRAPEVLPVEQGSLSERSALALIGDAVSRGTSGMLALTMGGFTKHVYLVGGEPKYVESNVPGERLGALLVARGVLDESERDVVLARCRDSDVRFGDALVDLGLLEPDQVLGFLDEQLRATLIDACVWLHGEWARYDLDLGQMAVLPMRCDPGDVFGRAAERTHRDRVLAWTHDHAAAAPTRQVRDRLDPGGWRVGSTAVSALYGLLDGTRSLGRIVEDGGNEALVEERMRSLYLLGEVGLLAF